MPLHVRAGRHAERLRLRALLPQGHGAQQQRQGPLPVLRGVRRLGEQTVQAEAAQPEREGGEHQVRPVPVPQQGGLRGLGAARQVRDAAGAHGLLRLGDDPVRHPRQQRLLVRHVPVQRGGLHAQHPGHAPHGQVAHAEVLQDPDGGVHHVLGGQPGAGCGRGHA